ncbi:hypothetical protein [Saccharothrix stipae]
MVVLLMALVSTLLGSLLSAGQASAQTRAAAVGPADIDRVTAVPANGRVTCYGYTGTFKVGTNVIVVNWASTSDECFGIATDRTIWHAWPNSDGWHRMPGGGYADSIAYLRFLENPDPDIKFRRVVVYTVSSDKFWCQEYVIPRWDGYWFEC